VPISLSSKLRGCKASTDISGNSGNTHLHSGKSGWKWTDGKKDSGRSLIHTEKNVQTTKRREVGRARYFAQIGDPGGVTRGLREEGRGRNSDA